MIGRNRGHVTTQGQILADLFARDGYSVISASKYLPRLKRLFDTVRVLVTARRQIDILHIDVYGGLSFVMEDVASRLGRLFGHSIVMTLHGGALPTFMAKYPRWTHRVLQRADLLVTPSPFLARAASRHGFTGTIVPNVIDLDDYPYLHRSSVKPRLLWMRSFHELYNPFMAVRVLAGLRQLYPDATLVMAGQDKGLEAETKRLADELGVSASIRFAGFLDKRQKAIEARAADIFINTSRVDNTPVALIEACAFGLPVVTTNVGGIQDLLTNEENGLLVGSEREGPMVEAVRQLIVEPGLAAQLSLNGRRLAQRSAWSDVRVRWEQIFMYLQTRVRGIASDVA